MSKASDEKYMDIISNPEFIKLTNDLLNAFKMNGTIWHIPNFESLNKINDLLPHIQRCFISKNLIKNITKNYEYYEALGDKFLKSALTSYIVLRFPNIITPNKITLAFEKYMSSQYQAELSRTFIPNYDKILNISYPDYASLSSDSKESLAEDIFEAFFGAIYIWSEKIMPCSGILYISDILRKMLDTKGDINEQSMMNLELNNISKLTNLLRLLYTLSTQDYNESYIDGNKPTMTLTIRFKNPQNVPVILTSSASAKTIKAAKTQVAGQMIDLLEKNGYSEKVINDIYNERLKNEKDIIEKIKRYLEEHKIKIAKRPKEKSKAVREDEEDYLITQPNTTTKTIKVYYYIETNKGNKEISFIGSDMSRFDALRYLLDITMTL